MTESAFVDKNRCVPYAVQCRKIRKNGRFVRGKQTMPVLQKVRAQGYAVNSEEHEPYIKCVTYPIFDYNNRIVAAMSLTGIPQMYGPEKEAQVHKVLKSTVRLISNELGR